MAGSFAGPEKGPAAQSEDFIRRLAAHPMPLTRGPANPESVRLVNGFDLQNLLSGVFHPEAATACLWLAAGDWDRAHALCQDLETAEGAYCHAIVHRQEPDASNARYWFHQVGRHPVFPALAKAAGAIDKQTGGKLRAPASWDPGYFIDLCQSVTGTELETAARAIQMAEWRLLLNYCLRSQTS